PAGTSCRRRIHRATSPGHPSPRGASSTAEGVPRPLTQLSYNRMVVSMQLTAPDFDAMFGALADATRRDIVRRAIDAEEGVAEIASHYPMSFAAVQKHVAVLERA